jgi:hypothetical protein
MMLRRVGLLFLVILAITAAGIAGPKKKSSLPPTVLSAQTVLVLIDPQAGTSIAAPLANKTAQDDVEKALMKWGRLKPVMEAETADLVITVRKGSGKVADATIGGLPTNDRPVVGQATDSTLRIGAQQGRAQDSAQTNPQSTSPHPQADIGAADDMFVVYNGHVDHPLERPAVWRFSSDDALSSPDVPAVQKFRKAIEEAEKQQQKNKP